MSVPKNIYKELVDRIQADIDHFAGNLPERTAISWHGYLAAMIEWQLISVADYRSLLRLIPAIDDDPAIHILTGRE
jgi:hypothetical protein